MTLHTKPKTACSVRMVVELMLLSIHVESRKFYRLTSYLVHCDIDSIFFGLSTRKSLYFTSGIYRDACGLKIWPTDGEMESVIQDMYPNKSFYPRRSMRRYMFTRSIFSGRPACYLPVIRYRDHP